MTALARITEVATASKAADHTSIETGAGVELFVSGSAPIQSGAGTELFVSGSAPSGSDLISGDGVEMFCCSV